MRINHFYFRFSYLFISFLYYVLLREPVDFMIYKLQMYFLHDFSDLILRMRLSFLIIITIIIAVWCEVVIVERDAHNTQNSVVMVQMDDAAYYDYIEDIIE